MKAFLALLAFIWLGLSPALAQNPTCPDRPASDSSNACANTRFVHGAVSAGRLANPGNLYVATTGNDSNDCLAPGTACLTLQHAATLAQTYDLKNSDLAINVGAGTFAGAVVNGYLVGGAAIKFLGAGSGSTTIGCGGLSSALVAEYGAFIKFGSMRLTCNTGYDVLVYEHAIANVIDSDVDFGPASVALVDVFSHSTFQVVGTNSFKISGGANFAFAGSSNATIFWGGNSLVTLTGTPAFTAFVSLIDNSVFDTGLGTTWTGSATGLRYSIALTSTIDTEQNTANLPGDNVGTVASGSRYYQSVGSCVGGAGGCRDVTAPTNLGAGGTAAMAPGSTDRGGSVIMTAGTGAGAAGVVRVNLYSTVLGDNDSGGFCVVNISSSGAQWNARASAQGFYNTAPGTIIINWDNNAVGLTNAAAYAINYTCN